MHFSDSVSVFLFSPPSECQKEAFVCLQRRIQRADPGRVTSSVAVVMFFTLLVETVMSKSKMSFSAATVLRGADYVMGSNLPSHSDVQVSCFTGNRIQVCECVRERECAIVLTTYQNLQSSSKVRTLLGS